MAKAAEHRAEHYASEDFSKLQEAVFVLCIISAQLLTQAGLGQAIAPLHIIGESFGNLPIGQLSWFPAAYSLTVGTFILIAGRLGDMYGHKLMFVLGFLWFGLWSLIAGVSVYSGSSIFFDICRALQGIGPAFTLPNALAILGHAYPPGPRKNMVFSLFGAAAPGGFVLGALFSSLFAQLAWWPWGYWVMAIACVFVAVLSIPVIPRMDREPKDPSGKHQFDFAGSLTGVAGLILVNVAWNQAPSVGWDDPSVFILLIIGILLFILFAFIETRVTDPLIPTNLLSGDTGFILACIAAGWSSFGIWVYYLWQFMQTLQGATPLNATARFVPVMISGFLAAVTTGFLISRIRTSIIMVLAMLAFCVGTVLTATTPVDQIYWAQIFVAILIMPWGMDMSFPAATIILSDVVPREQQGIAASLVNTVVNYSISIGLGIAGTVQVYANRSTPDDVLRGFRLAWYTGIGLSGMGVLVATAYVIKSSIKSQVRHHHEEPTQLDTIE
ncbi:Drug resistance protein [Bifiguratus adelaidae]|uniref:Drug resistance protein n=1 Tax=Bifiguratus adelaidae TaxID=1938954 RepID=A0A261Y247_9FUNG|nr:Drug resistance protein [Bifiguratus adelaidae]